VVRRASVVRMSPTSPLQDPPAAVTVMWRPGCPFCALLLRGLERSGLAFERIDIWEDPEAAAWVRGVADGNETVPTVRVTAASGASDARADARAEVDADAPTEIALVNPSPRAVLDAVARLAPHALPSALSIDAPRARAGAGPIVRLRTWLRTSAGRQGS